MTGNSLKRRMDRLGRQSGDWGDILPLIRQKKRYRDLTDAQKERYWKYHGTTKESAEMIETLVLGSVPDFVLEKMPKKMTSEEEQKHIANVAAEIEEILNEKH